VVAVTRHLGGPAVIFRRPTSGGAPTSATATAPDVISDVIEVTPFTDAQSMARRGLVRVSRFRLGYGHIPQVMVRGRMANRAKYLEVADPNKAADWTANCPASGQS
jgi:hypothetical protein